MNAERRLVDIIECLRAVQDINLFLMVICAGILIFSVVAMGLCALYMVCLGLRDLIMTCKKE